MALISQVTFGLRCSKHRLTCFEFLNQRITLLRVHIQGSLLDRGTPTPHYMLKLSIDPSISAGCQLSRFSPLNPRGFLTMRSLHVKSALRRSYSERPTVLISTAS